MNAPTRFMLSSETEINDDAVRRRAALAEQLEQLPDEAFTRLQYLQTQVGCLNRCAFCSQQAGMQVWQLSATGLADLTAALAQVTGRRGLRLAAARHTHRPGVIFPYLDNDIRSYAHLGDLARYCAEDLSVRLRISTVGYSRRNAHLAAMHARIVAEHADVVAGVRFSLTPYTVGYRTDRGEYQADLAAALRTWRPYVDRVGPGAATAAVELRFAPLIGITDLFDEVVDGRRILCAPPHLLVSLEEAGRPERGRRSIRRKSNAFA